MKLCFTAFLTVGSLQLNDLVVLMSLMWLESYDGLHGLKFNFRSYSLSGIFMYRGWLVTLSQVCNHGFIKT